MMKTNAVQSTPRIKGENKPGTDSRGPGAAFVAIALNMSWQLAIVLLVPVLGGHLLDTHYKTSPVWMIVGMVVALAGCIIVVRQTIQALNELMRRNIKEDRK